MRIAVPGLFLAGAVAELLYIRQLEQMGFALNLLSGAAGAIIPVLLAMILSADRENFQRNVGLGILAIFLVITASLILI